jgi:hypothetical protein
MPALHIRDVDEKLMQRLKADAALSGITLREHVIKQLGGERIGNHRTEDVPGPEEVPGGKGGAGGLEGVSASIAAGAAPPSEDLCGYEYCHHARKRHGNKCCFVVDCRCGGFE